LYDVNPEDIRQSLESPNISVVRFTVPIIIHTTVLPPQVNADYLETCIPKNAKIYANFLKANASELLRGRYVTDCLFDGVDGTFVSVGSVDDNIHRRIPEHRNTLNFAHYQLVRFLTTIFGLIGLIVYVRIIMSAFREPIAFRHHHSHAEDDHRGSRELGDADDTIPLMGVKQKTD
jgi:hypothetical protein